MKVGKLKKDKRYDSRNDKSLGIQTYGERNDYPQQVEYVVNASITGKSCVNVYGKFISGRGFINEDISAKVVNKQGHTLDHILNEIRKDYALWGGFALHVNYNANYKIVSIQHVPLETIRFEKFDENRHFDRVALHPDWGRNYTNLYKWRKEDIDFIHLYNPNPSAIDKQVESVEGWANYQGQIYYYSNQGEKTYPIPVLDSALTDMSTQEGISNVSYRNARNNFLTAGMFVDYVNNDESEEQENETEKAILDFQGDEEAVKIMYIQCKDPTEKPEFISFKGQNYDKEFDSTRKSVREDIGAAFSQPPILRAENVGANFGADLMKNAYDFYNSVVENERLTVERSFDTVFKNWHEQFEADFSIEALEYTAKSRELNTIPTELLGTLTINEKRALVGYDELEDSDNDKSLLAEKIGVGGVQAMKEIVADPNMTEDSKKGLLKLLFALTDEEAESVIPSKNKK